MRITIEENGISIEFKDLDEKKEFFESSLFKELLSWDLRTKEKKWIDIDKWLKEHPPTINPYIQQDPIPDHIQDPPIDISPHIDDPVRFPSTTEPYRPLWTTVTQHTEQRGGCDATPKFDGCDATPRYGKATVDFPSKYPCDATPEFLKQKKTTKSRRKKNV